LKISQQFFGFENLSFVGGVFTKQGPDKVGFYAKNAAQFNSIRP
jgi:hypothetical protein